MSDATKIEWTDTTWNPIRGCSRVSAGCENCYAERLAATRLRHLDSYDGLAEMTPAGPRWTSEVRLVPERLDDPLRWRKPRRVFVNSMSDLFHEELSNEKIAAVFGVMAASRKQTFQVLTKRPERMRAWFRWLDGAAGTAAEMFPADSHEWRRAHALAASALREGAGAMVYAAQVLDVGWPLPNVHLGVSTENQATADERIPLLLDTPAAVRFVSAEPLLEPIDLDAITRPDDAYFTWRGEKGALPPSRDEPDDYTYFTKLDRSIDWLIVGGESGPGHRPMDPDWARDLRDQCAEAGVPFFMKQMAGKEPIPDDLDIRQFPDDAHHLEAHAPIRVAGRAALTTPRARSAHRYERGDRA